MNSLVFTPDRHPDLACVVIGLGLLGTAVARRFAGTVPRSAAQAEGFVAPWTEAEALSDRLDRLLERREVSRVEMLWCAGKAGFGADDATMEAEVNVFARVVERVQSRFGDALAVSLMSSAGGIYEGAGFVSDVGTVAPQRPYGVWKLRMEQRLLERCATARIYRVSSAFGRYRPRQRLGLLNVLLERAIDGGIAQIYASPTTLRDYIFSDDIARYVVDGVLEGRSAGTHILASARPSSVESLIKQVTTVTNRRIRAQYRSHHANARDIVFSRSILPPGLQVSTLEESVRLLAAHRRGGIEERVLWADAAAE